MNVALWAVIGYLAGALPWAFVVARVTGHADVLRGAGRAAGETDAHHLLRTAGAGRAAVAAATLDVLKGFVPVLLAALFVDVHEAAACGVGAVAGHCWPPVLRRLAGRGLAAAAGVFLAVLPVEMAIGGAVTALGSLAGAGGLASSVGFGAVPVLAGWRAQPAPYRLASWAIIAMIVARRLEGVSADVESGVPAWRAVLRRALFDVSAARDRPASA